MCFLYHLFLPTDKEEGESEASEESSDEEAASESPKKTSPSKETEEVEEKLSGLTVNEPEKSEEEEKKE